MVGLPANFSRKASWLEAAHRARRLAETCDRPENRERYSQHAARLEEAARQQGENS